MAVVAAVRVSLTWAVPVTVGVPVAAEFDGPGVTSSTPVDSILLSPVQMAPWLAQSVVTAERHGHVCVAGRLHGDLPPDVLARLHPPYIDAPRRPSP